MKSKLKVYRQEYPILSHIPPHLKEQKIKSLKGFVVIRFPAAYFRKAPYSLSPLWELIEPIDSEGCVIRTCRNKTFLDKFVKYLKREKIDYQEFVLE